MADITQADIDAAVAAATAPLTSKIADLEGKVNAPPPKQEAPKYTRAELSQAVEDGKINEAQAQDILDKQQAAQTEKLVQDTVASTSRRSRKARR